MITFVSCFLPDILQHFLDNIPDSVLFILSTMQEQFILHQLGGEIWHTCYTMACPDWKRMARVTILLPCKMRLVSAPDLCSWIVGI